MSGHVETGMVALGDKVLVLPRNETAVIKGMSMTYDFLIYIWIPVIKVCDINF